LLRYGLPDVAIRIPPLDAADEDLTEWKSPPEDAT
jgi:hypothetical protein